MKKRLLNRLDAQGAIYEVDFKARTFRLVGWNGRSGHDLPDLRGKLRKPTDFKHWFFVEAPE